MRLGPSIDTDLGRVERGHTPRTPLGLRLAAHLNPVAFTEADWHSVTSMRCFGCRLVDTQVLEVVRLVPPVDKNLHLGFEHLNDTALPVLFRLVTHVNVVTNFEL